MQSSKKQNTPPAAKEGFSEAGPGRPIISETSSLTLRLNEMERKVNFFDERLKKIEKNFKTGDKTVASYSTENKNLQAEIVSLVKKMGETQDKNMKEWREAQEIGKAMIKEEVIRLLREFHVIDQTPSTFKGGNGEGDLHQDFNSESNEQCISTEISTTPISTTEELPMESDSKGKGIDATASWDEENCAGTSNTMNEIISTADVTDASNKESSGQPENKIEPCEKNAVEELGESVELVTITDSDDDSECKPPQLTSKSASNENHAANNQLQTSSGRNTVPNFAYLPSWTIPNKLRNDKIDSKIKSGIKRVIIPSNNKISEEKLERILTGMKDLLELDIGPISWNVVQAMTKLQLDSVVILHLNDIGLSDDNLKNILSIRKQMKRVTRVRRLNSLRVLTLERQNSLTDKSLEYVADFAPNLKKLTLSSCDECTDEGIAELAKPRSGLSLNLVELSLEHCKGLTNLSLIHLVKFPNLQKLKLVEMPAITMTAAENFSWSRNEIGGNMCEVMIY